MKKFRLLALSLLSSVFGLASCGNDVPNQIQQPGYEEYLASLSQAGQGTGTGSQSNSGSQNSSSSQSGQSVSPSGGSNGSSSSGSVSGGSSGGGSASGESSGGGSGSGESSGGGSATEGQGSGQGTSIGTNETIDTSQYIEPVKNEMIPVAQLILGIDEASIHFITGDEAVEDENDIYLYNEGSLVFAELYYFCDSTMTTCEECIEALQVGLPSTAVFNENYSSYDEQTYYDYWYEVGDFYHVLYVAKSGDGNGNDLIFCVYDVVPSSLIEEYMIQVYGEVF